MKPLKQYVLNRPGFYGMKYDDTLYLISIAKAVKENENAVVLHKYYMRKKEYLDFQDFIAGGIGGDASVPRMRFCKETISLKHFERIFNVNVNDIKKDTAKDLLVEINKLLQKNVLTNDGTKFVSLDDSANFSKFREAVEEAFKSEQTSVDNNDIYSDSNLALKLYNVGQANCSALYGDDGLHAVFDLGSRNRKNILPVKMLTKDTLDSEGNGRPLLFVISHFHEDHINLCNRIPAKAYDNAVFVMPYVDVDSDEDVNLSLNAQYLIVSAFYGGSKMVIMKNSSPSPVSINGIEFYKGKDYAGGNKAERLNAEGVISYFNLKDKKILLPGDCLYEYWPKHFYDVTHLVIPHHVCPIDEDEIENIKPENVKEAFGFSKFNMGYHHPHTSHSDKFKTVRMFSYCNSEIDYAMYRYKTVLAEKGKTETIDEPIVVNETPDNVEFLSNSDYREW